MNWNSNQAVRAGRALNMQLLFWAIAALAACGLLIWILSRQHGEYQGRSSGFLIGDGQVGSRLYFADGSCAQCHPINGVGNRRASDLGYSRVPENGAGGFVASIWNHAPAMWETMQRERTSLRRFTRNELAHLFAFLYIARYMGEPGDPGQGERLFREKQCGYCHSVDGMGGKPGPDLAEVGAVENPILWTQAMWNHIPAMESAVDKAGLRRIRFEDSDMNHIFAYIRGVSRGVRRNSAELMVASPDHGWDVFRSKCQSCHPMNGGGGQFAPELRHGDKSPLTLPQFAGLMWNHPPEIWRLPAGAPARPVFEGQEVADLLSFLMNLHYSEPQGSAEIGRTVFSERGCSQCHGAEALGTHIAPGIRGRQTVTSLTISKALWDHGPDMYQLARQLGLPWPEMAGHDAGDLIAFLNKTTVRR